MKTFDEIKRIAMKANEIQKIEAGDDKKSLERCEREEETINEFNTVNDVFMENLHQFVTEQSANFDLLFSWEEPETQFFLLKSMQENTRQLVFKRNQQFQNAQVILIQNDSKNTMPKDVVSLISQFTHFNSNSYKENLASQALTTPLDQKKLDEYIEKSKTPTRSTSPGGCVIS